MNSTAKLDAIEKLIRMSGLEKRQAEDYLAKSHWNVDEAYRMYKKNQFAQQGLKSTNRFSETKGVPIRPTQGQAGLSLRPSTQILGGFGSLGTVMTGTGSYTDTSGIHPGFLPPQPVPKFPVEHPQQKERVIPIQVENAGSRFERPAAVGTRSMTPPTYRKPVMPTRVEYPNNPPVSHHTQNLADKFPKSQSYPVPTKGDNFPTKGDNFPTKGVNFTTKGGYFPTKGDNFPTKGDTFPSKGDNFLRQQQHVNETNATVIKVGSMPAEKENKATGDEPDKVVAPSSTPKLLKRGISKISQNAMLVDEERKSVLHDIAEDCHDNMYIQTFVLPDVTGYNDTFRAFLEKDLIETSTLVALEQAGRLNWWAELGVCQRLLPMATSGDGNCLLHAASLGMWGIHDRQLMLRKALYATLTTKYYRNALQRRWRWQQTQANKQAGLIFSELEWSKEWENVLKLASTTPRSLPGTMHRNNSCCDNMLTQSHGGESHVDDSPVVYESLEDFHVFVLAHVIQRPIIVVADTILRDANGDALAPIPFGGIYLPMEANATHCYRSPLLLTYDAAHFSALVPMEKNGELEGSGLPVAIPIVGPELTILPLHFSIDPGQNFNWETNNATFNMSEENKLNVLKRYMDLEKLPICASYSDSNSDDKNSTGSYESDDGLIDKSKKKDNKMSQQLQTVSKQFGSFGKSVGKKLKNLGKGNKDEKKGVGRKVSLTQSTKILSALGDSEHQNVWCCKLTLKKSDTHQKMIDNYMVDAKARFKTDTASRQLRNDEIISRGQNGGSSSKTQQVHCVTSGCHAFGTIETSYLCSKCFADQKQQLIDQENDMYKNFNSKQQHQQKTDNNVTRVGKSKFYDMKDGDIEVVSKNVKPNLVVNLNPQKKVHNSRDSYPVPSRPRSRTPSPDYDNVDYPLAPSQHPVPAGKPTGKTPLYESKSVASPCKNPTCTFYGSKDMDNYCSGCYKALRKNDMKLV